MLCLTHLLYLECTYAIIYNIFHFFECNLYVAIVTSAIRWPVLMTFDLIKRNKWYYINSIEHRYLFVFFQIGYHDNGWNVLFPYHTPEVSKSRWDWSLCCYVWIERFVTLREMEINRLVTIKQRQPYINIRGIDIVCSRLIIL